MVVVAASHTNSSLATRCRQFSPTVVIGRMGHEVRECKCKVRWEMDE